MALSEQDRETLGDWWDSAEDDSWSLATLYPAVEAIVARHVAAFRIAAVDAIEAERDLWRSEVNRRALDSASAIVRTLSPDG